MTAFSSQQTAISPDFPAAVSDPRLVLWDIDRTVLNTGGGTLRAMTRAGQAVFGERFSLEGVERTGRLDPHVLQEGAALSGFQVDRQKSDAFRQMYTKLLPSELADIRLLPGAANLYDRLNHIDGLRVGVVTGNYAEAALIKLEIIGFDTQGLTNNGFGLDQPTRPALVAQAMQAGDYSFVGDQVLVIGDSTHDVTAALDNGCHVLAVATGNDSVDVLKGIAGETPRACVVPNLMDPLVLGFVCRFLAVREAAQ